jgi:copper chaperone
MIRLKITGMTCGHCERAVRSALESVEGVTRVVEVDRDKGSASVEGSAEIAVLVAAVREEGYEAEAAP